MKRKRTVILCCQRKELLARADLILYFDANGQLEHQGSYGEFRRTLPELFKSKKCLGDAKTLECKTAQERWKLLKNVTKMSLGMRPKSKKQTRKSFKKPFKRLESSTQLGFCHGLMLHNSPIILEEEQETTQQLLRKSKFHNPSKNLAKLAIHNEHQKKLMLLENQRQSSFSIAQETFGFAHRFVSRMTSNTSQLSGVSGFSDDQDEDLDLDGLITHHDGSWDEEERGQTGSIRNKVFNTYFKSGGRFNFCFFLAFSIGFQGVKIFNDFLLKNPNEDFLKMYLSLSALALILSIIANICGQNLGAQARQTLHAELLRHIFKIKPYLFEVLPSSRFISRLAQDTFIIDQKLPSCVQRMSLVTFICLGALTVNAVQSPIFLVFACPLILLYWSIQYFYRSSSIELQRIESSTRAPYISHLSNSLCSLVTLRAFNEEIRLTNQFCDQLDANTTALLLLQSGSRWLGVSLDMAGSVIVFASVISCLIGTPNATIGLALNYSLLVPIYLAWVIKFLTEMENCLNAVERVLEYMDLEHEEDKNGLEIQSLDDFHLKFQKVSLSHGDVSRPVVHHVSFDIPPGQRVALVGRSGSGKSTIIHSLSAMSRIVQGDIKLGPFSLNSLPISILRKHIKTVPQDVSLFAGTIKTILDPKDKHELESIQKVLDDLELKKYNLNDQVEPFGDNLSKAQKQELIIAQAILDQPKILVLDEATSSLEDDRLLIAKLFKLCKNHNITLINVVHRLSNITEYDRVLVIGDGRILEDGKPLELLKKPMGFFSALYRNSL